MRVGTRRTRVLRATHRSKHARRRACRRFKQAWLGTNKRVPRCASESIAGTKMVAIDSAQDIPASRPADSGHTGTIVMFALLGSALLVTASLLFDLGAGSGWHVAAEMVSRFSLFLFAAAMGVEPLSRLLPFAAIRGIGRERASLTLAFAATAGVAAK